MWLFSSPEVKLHNNPLLDSNTWAQRVSHNPGHHDLDVHAHNLQFRKQVDMDIGKLYAETRFGTDFVTHKRGCMESRWVTYVHNILAQFSECCEPMFR